MTMKLAENIRTFRKQRSLTQEQLAEVLGVTVGAVYKWEAGLSQPELSLIVEMADFFDTSVDVLLGYEMKENRLQNTIDRLKTYNHEKDISGLAEAEKALKKYPNIFDIVYYSARLYNNFSLEQETESYSARALELFELAGKLLPQNTDPKINETTLCGNMATVLLNMGKNEQAITLMQAHNAGGFYDSKIGLTMASDNLHPDQAQAYLSDALLQIVSLLIETVMGYSNLYFASGDYLSAKDMLSLVLPFFLGLKKDGQSNFLDKICSSFFVLLASTQQKLSRQEEARASLLKAKELAGAFDSSPNYHVDNLKFIKGKESSSCYDDLGTTAFEGIRSTLAALEDESLQELWETLL